MSSTKENYIGTEAERIKAYYEDRSRNLRISMLQERLSELHRQGVVEGEEVDNLLDEIAIIQNKLRFAWGIED